jgi:HD superfamily phosphohydrolase
MVQTADSLEDRAVFRRLRHVFQQAFQQFLWISAELSRGTMP